MLVAGALFPLAPRSAGRRRRGGWSNACFFALLGGSLAFYGSALYLGFHEGRLVVDRGPDARSRRRRRPPLHPPLIMGAGIAMFARVLARCSWSLVRSVAARRSPLRPFVLAGCAALAVGTLQGPGPGGAAR